ncbi:MAG TPA: PqqD family protein [Solirubrobacteraceae bacterium]
MSDDIVFRQVTGPLFTRVDDDLMAVDTQGGLVFTFNRSAARIWELLQDWTTLDAVCTQLQRQYAVEPDRCAAQVTGLVERLREAGLVEQRHGRPS